MSFLAPSILWGLLAASIPLIIHLLSIRRTRTVEFSSIRFIKELEHETIRKLKLRQWLLLFLRTLAIMLIILVFARPVKVGYFPPWAAGTQTTRMVLLMDNSASMSAQFAGQSLLDRAKNSVVKILEDVEGRISLDIYQTTPLSRHYSGQISSRREVETALAGIEPAYGEDHLWRTVNQLLSQVEFERGEEKEANREFYIFSDFPATLPENWTVQTGNSEQDGSGWHFFLFSQPTIRNNLSIASAEVRSQLRLAGHLVEVGTRVQSQSRERRKDVPIQLYFDAERVGQVVSDFRPGKAKDFVFQAFPGRSGFVHGNVEIPADDYEPDNHRFFQFSIPPQIRCKLVAASEEQLAFIKTALAAIDQDALFIDLAQVITSSDRVLALEESDVLILIDPGALRPSMVREIEKFVKRGGGIIAFVADEYSSAGAATALTNLGFPRPQGVSKLRDELFHQVSAVELDHPLFADLPVRDLDQEMPQVFSHVRLTPSREDRALLALSNGDPFLLETRTPGLRLLLFASPPDLHWTDLPVKGLFVPLLHRMLVYLAADDGPGNSVTVDDHLAVPLARRFLANELELATPSGHRILLVPDYREELVKIEDVHEPGVYRLLADGLEVFSFVANIAQTEDPQRRLGSDDLTRIFPTYHTRLIRWDADPVAAVREARRGTELWRPFLIAALMVLVAETWVGRVKAEKPGRD